MALAQKRVTLKQKRLPTARHRPRMGQLYDGHNTAVIPPFDSGSYRALQKQLLGQRVALGDTAVVGASARRP